MNYLPDLLTATKHGDVAWRDAGGLNEPDVTATQDDPRLTDVAITNARGLNTLAAPVWLLVPITAVFRFDCPIAITGANSGRNIDVLLA